LGPGAGERSDAEYVVDRGVTPPRLPREGALVSMDRECEEEVEEEEGWPKPRLAEGGSANKSVEW